MTAAESYVAVDQARIGEVRAWLAQQIDYTVPVGRLLLMELLALAEAGLTQSVPLMEGGRAMMPKPRVQGVGAMRQKRLPLTTERAAMLAKVHVAKKQLGLDDAAYRDVVTRITGTDSSAAASDAALHRLLAEFTRLGFKQARPLQRSAKPNVGLIYALWAGLRPYVDDHSPEALRAFVRRQTCTRLHPAGVDAPEFLDGVQANRVIEGLKAWLARAQHKGASV